MHSDLELSGVQRREKTVQLLRDNGQLTVKELADRFGVSEMTIRRDFHVLEDQGIAVLYYGGARLKNTGSVESTFSSRQQTLYEYKKRIARYAAGLIKDGDVIFMDTSTTVLLILRYMADLKVTIITNSFPIMQEVYDKPNIELHMAPGKYQSVFGGPLDYTTAEYLGRFNYNKAFFGASAVDARFGVSAVMEIEGAAKRVVYGNAEENYLLVDHTKLGKRNLIQYNSVKDYTAIIMDDEISDDDRAEIARNGGNLWIT